MERDLVLTSMNKGVVTLTLNKPESRNALSVAMLNRLSEALADAQDNKEARVVVLAAAGPVFCPGHDLKEMSEARQEGRSRTRFFQENDDALFISHAANSQSSASRYCRRSRCCDSSWVSARRQLRLGHCNTGGEIRNSRGKHWFVLLNPDGRIIKKCIKKARHANAADR